MVAAKRGARALWRRDGVKKRRDAMILVLGLRV